MTLNPGRSLEEIDQDLKDIQERRESLIKGTRDVVMLCSKSIISLHHNQIEDAKGKMGQARTMLEELRKHAGQDLSRYLVVPEQELVEANSLLAIMQDQPVPSMKNLNVAGESYLTGLLDCVGEIK
jgi:translin